MNTQPTNKRKGMGLAGVLVLTALASMLLLTLANLVCGHLARARNAEGREQALLMAESALRVAARRVLADNTTTEPVALL
ncbi:MAG: hypothetical protein KC910_35315, partial [Candidatus Eremiobacteraeota bacterium]|nr:hypothetical protein [Candidatus Eremiobacteraeota bacterium]